MASKRILISLSPIQVEGLEALMREDLQSNVSAYVGFLISQEKKHRQETIKNPVGRPRKNPSSSETNDEQNQEEDPWNLAQYDDTRYDIVHPWPDMDNDYLTLRGYHRFMIGWKGIDMLTNKPHPYPAPEYATHREDYSKPKDAPTTLKAPATPARVPKKAK